MKVGDVVWTFLPSLESEGYGEQGPDCLRQVVIVEIDNNYNHILACGSVPETGEPDRDANATVIGSRKDFWELEAMAIAAYSNALDSRADELHEEESALRQRGREARQRLSEIARS